MILAALVLAGWVWQEPQTTTDTCTYERPGHFYVVEWEHATMPGAVETTNPPEDLYNGTIRVYEVKDAKKVKVGEVDRTGLGEGIGDGCGEVESELDFVLKKAK